MSGSPTGRTVRLTVAQAVVTYLAKQYSVAGGTRRRLIPATLGIFGHGNVAGFGQALDQLSDLMPFVQGRHEQSLVHVGVGYAKATRRHATLAVTASIGPGRRPVRGLRGRDGPAAAQRVRGRPRQPAVVPVTRRSPESGQSSNIQRKIGKER